MKKAVDVVRELITSARKSGERVGDMVTEKVLVDKLRRELKLGPDEPVVIEGVRVTAASNREIMEIKAIGYAALRWQVILTPVDARTLLKACKDEELMALIPIVVDQQMDSLNYEDPLDDMSAMEEAQMKKALEELGFENLEI